MIPNMPLRACVNKLKLWILLQPALVCPRAVQYVQNKPFMVELEYQQERQSAPRTNHHLPESWLGSRARTTSAARPQN